MSETWCDSSLAFQERLVREAINELEKDLRLIEESVALTAVVNEEGKHDEDMDYDQGLPQKIRHFREYLNTLREGIQGLKHVRRER